MKKLPETFLDSLEGVAGFNRTSFENVHQSAEQVTSVRLNTSKLYSHNEAGSKTENNVLAFPLEQKVPWCHTGYYLKQRPSFTFDPLFHAGCYYVQEASSMFIEQAFLQLLDASGDLRVLDLAAAPGGKSTHILSLISSDSLLVSNEVIRSRSHILTDNIVKWGSSNAFVTNNDPAAFKNLPGYFDVMVVDAPCSGSGLFRRDADAIDEWSLNNVQLCSQRQQRILADALPALKQGGLLIYSTCSFSKAEDEAIADWLMNEWNMESLSLQIASEWGIVESTSAAGGKGYRFYPDKLRGEGFFMACFRKTDAVTGTFKFKSGRKEKISARERQVVEKMVDTQGMELISFREKIFAVKEGFLEDLHLLQSVLNLQYAGVRVGEVMKEKLIPDHALAQSLIIDTGAPFTNLDEEQAIRYLQRQELSFTPENHGWQVVRYKGYNLGWINALKNRINNYYPKELRILKQHNDAAFDK